MTAEAKMLEKLWELRNRPVLPQFEVSETSDEFSLSSDSSIALPKKKTPEAEKPPCEKLNIEDLLPKRRSFYQRYIKHLKKDYPACSSTPVPDKIKFRTDIPDVSPINKQIKNSKKEVQTKQKDVNKKNINEDANRLTDDTNKNLQHCEQTPKHAKNNLLPMAICKKASSSNQIHLEKEQIRTSKAFLDGNQEKANGVCVSTNTTPQSPIFLTPLVPLSKRKTVATNTSAEFNKTAVGKTLTAVDTATSPKTKDAASSPVLKPSNNRRKQTPTVVDTVKLDEPVNTSLSLRSRSPSKRTDTISTRNQSLQTSKFNEVGSTTVDKSPKRKDSATLQETANITASKNVSPSKKTNTDNKSVSVLTRTNKSIQTSKTNELLIASIITPENKDKIPSQEPENDPSSSRRKSRNLSKKNTETEQILTTCNKSIQTSKNENNKPETILTRSQSKPISSINNIDSSMCVDTVTSLKTKEVEKPPDKSADIAMPLESKKIREKNLSEIPSKQTSIVDNSTALVDSMVNKNITTSQEPKNVSKSKRRKRKQKNITASSNIDNETKSHEPDLMSDNNIKQNTVEIPPESKSMRSAEQPVNTSTLLEGRNKNTDNIEVNATKNNIDTTKPSKSRSKQRLKDDVNDTPYQHNNEDVTLSRESVNISNKASSDNLDNLLEPLSNSLEGIVPLRSPIVNTNSRNADNLIEIQLSKTKDEAISKNTTDVTKETKNTKTKSKSKTVNVVLSNDDNLSTHTDLFESQQLMLSKTKDESTLRNITNIAKGLETTRTRLKSKTSAEDTAPAKSTNDRVLSNECADSSPNPENSINLFENQQLGLSKTSHEPTSKNNTKAKRGRKAKVKSKTSTEDVPSRSKTADEVVSNEYIDLGPDLSRNSRNATRLLESPQLGSSKANEPTSKSNTIVTRGRKNTKTKLKSEAKQVVSDKNKNDENKAPNEKNEDEKENQVNNVIRLRSSKMETLDSTDLPKKHKNSKKKSKCWSKQELDVLQYFTDFTSKKTSSRSNRNTRSKDNPEALQEQQKYSDLTSKRTTSRSNRNMRSNKIIEASQEQREYPESTNPIENKRKPGRKRVRNVNTKSKEVVEPNINIESSKQTIHHSESDIVTRNSQTEIGEVETEPTNTTTNLVRTNSTNAKNGKPMNEPIESTSILVHSTKVDINENEAVAEENNDDVNANEAIVEENDDDIQLSPNFPKRKLVPVNSKANKNMKYTSNVAGTPENDIHEPTQSTDTNNDSVFKKPYEVKPKTANKKNSISLRSSSPVDSYCHSVLKSKGSITRSRSRISSEVKSLIKDGILHSKKLTFSIDGMEKTFDWITNEEYSLKPTTQSSVSVCTNYEYDGGIFGLIEIKPGGLKNWSVSNNYDLSCVVLLGQGEVQVHNRCCTIQTYCRFFVPKGAMYKIKNLSDTEILKLEFQKSISGFKPMTNNGRVY